MTATKGVWRVLAAVLVAAGIALTAAAAETGKKQVPTSRPRMVLSFAPLVKDMFGERRVPGLQR